MLRAGGCFLSTSCVPSSGSLTCRGLRGPGEQTRNVALPTRGSAALPRVPWPSRQRQSGLLGCWVKGDSPLLSLRRPGHLMGVSAVSERFHSLSKVTQGVCVGGRGVQGHGPGTHGPQGAQPGPHQPGLQTGDRLGGRGLAPPEADGATLPTSASVEAPPHPGGQHGRQAWTLAQPGCPHWQTPLTKGLAARTDLCSGGVPSFCPDERVSGLKPQHRSLSPGPVGESRASAFREPSLLRLPRHAPFLQACSNQGPWAPWQQ